MLPEALAPVAASPPATAADDAMAELTADPTAVPTATATFAPIIVPMAVDMTLAVAFASGIETYCLFATHQRALLAFRLLAL